MARSPSIARGQLEILRYVLEHHPVTVRQVAEHLAATRGLTRTTALNVMESLREKGYLSREQVDGVYHYSPCLSKRELLRGLVREFVEQVLAGSHEPVVAYLIEEADLTDGELRKLQQRVRELEAQEHSP